ncbi:XPA protein C-terminus-domain-containing protein [Lipomyces oligophaga]|uniref:XPA protein C-terminus-domain-containing protein n=1 Tax=Lipomyces oligophaga TaxID=45792 RepID=UPI0034CD364F
MVGLTADQLARIEENRKKARERLAARAESKAKEAANRAVEAAPVTLTQPAVRTLPVSVRDAGQTVTEHSNGPKRVNDGKSDSANGQDGARKRPYDNIRPAKMFQNFIEYDLSKMKDTRGGFMPEEENERSGMTLEEWKAKQKKTVEDPLRALNPDDNPKCFECDSLEIDYEFYNTFGCRVCRTCKNKIPEKYSLLTKTECKEDYLLTDPELRSKEDLPHLERPNPHKNTYSNMMLYLRYQVEEFSFKKWGGEEGLDKEYERRVEMKKEKKGKKFTEKLRQMRQRTRTATWNKRLHETAHEHVWGPETRLPGKDMAVRQCTECGMETEEIVF